MAASVQRKHGLLRGATAILIVQISSTGVLPASAQSLPPPADFAACPVALDASSYQVGWFHNSPAGTLDQDGFWAAPTAGLPTYGGAQGPDIGSAATDTPALVPGSLTYQTTNPLVTYARIGGIATNDNAASAHAAGRYVTYTFRTSATVSARALDRIGYGMNPNFARLTPGSYHITALLSNDGFATAERIVDAQPVQTTPNAYVFVPIASARSIVLQPSTTYAIRVVFHNASAQGTFQWDDFQVSTASCPSSNLSIVKTNTPAAGEHDAAGDTLRPGATTRYTIVVRNHGPTSINGANIVDTPVAGLNCTAPAACSSQPANVCASTSYPFSQLSGPGVTLATMPSGASATLTVECMVR